MKRDIPFWKGAACLLITVFLGVFVFGMLLIGAYSAAGIFFALGFVGCWVVLSLGGEPNDANASLEHTTNKDLEVFQSVPKVRRNIHVRMLITGLIIGLGFVAALIWLVLFSYGTSDTINSGFRFILLVVILAIIVTWVVEPKE